MYRVWLQCGEETLALDGSGPGPRIESAGLKPAAAAAAKSVVREELGLTEILPVMIEDTPANIEAAWQSLGCWLARASQEPVYLVCQAAAGEVAWRSRVRLGWLEALSPGAGLRARGSLGGRLVIERDASWEGPESQAALSNANGQNTTSYLNVFNCDDGAGTPPQQRQNWVEIAAGAVSGDLPAALRLELVNLGSERLLDVWVGQNWTHSWSGGQVYEAEQAAGASGVPDTSCSGGMQVVKDLASGSETELLRWPLSGETLAAAAGQRVHALVRFASPGWETNTQFRLELLWHMTPVWRSDLVQPRADRALQIRDLFQLRLPGPDGGAIPAGLDLVLSGRQSSGQARQLRFDFLALVSADGWRYLTCSAYGTATGERVVDDGLAGRLYSDDGAGGEAAEVWVGFGGRLRLRPGRCQRLYFFSHSVLANQAPVAHSLGVKVFFRPRRRTL